MEPDGKTGRETPWVDGKRDGTGRLSKWTGRDGKREMYIMRGNYKPRPIWTGPTARVCSDTPLSGKRKARLQEVQILLYLPIELHPHKSLQFFVEIQQGISYGFGGGFYGFRLWKMKFLTIPLIFAGFVLLGRYLPTTYCSIYYVFKRTKEEHGLLNLQKKNHGCSRDWTCEFKVKDQHLSH